MFRATRTATAVVLMLAVAALPVVLDRCAESCQAHQDTIASSPSCHHPTSAAFRIGHVPTACGHDHTGTAVTWAKSSAPAGRSFGPLVAAADVPTSLTSAASDQCVVADGPPGSSIRPDARSLPLRI